MSETTQVEQGIAEVLIEEEALRDRVAELGAEISADYTGRDLLLVGVLKGAVFFMADLMRSIDVHCEVDFMAISSYGASTDSSGVVRILKDLDTAIDGRDVIVVEDVVDTGLTMNYLCKTLRLRRPGSLAVATLLDRPYRRLVDELPVRYVGFTVPDELFVGYGFDLDERYRNLPDLHVLRPEAGPRAA